MIKNYNFTKVGKYYDVSDTTIRKWCDSYNLPRSSQKIKNITQEEWEKI